jgi:hypothetical protein
MQYTIAKQASKRFAVQLLFSFASCQFPIVIFHCSGRVRSMTNDQSKMENGK